MINCAIYPRKSKRDDNSDSMELQVSNGIRYLDDKYGEGNYSVTIYDGDYALTGHSTGKRKDFLRMMDDVRSGKIQIVVIMRYDRIARNMRDFCNLYHDMEQAGCILVSISQQIDTSTPYGKNFMYQMAAMAELEWAIISERYKDSAKYKREHGYAYTGNVPYGYKIEKQADGHKRVVKDPEHDANVIFNYYRLCQNKYRTVRHIRANIDPNFTYDILRSMLATDMYAGRVQGNDHFCEPYMTIQEIESLRNMRCQKQTPSNRCYLFSRLVTCPYCGANMIATTSGQYKLQYYRCGYVAHQYVHKGILIREDFIEQYLVDKVDEILAHKVATIKITRPKVVDRSAEIAELEREKERLNYLFEKGRMEVDLYEKKYAALDEEIASLVPEEASNYTNVREVLQGDWRTLYAKLDRPHRKMFWGRIIDHIVVNKCGDIIDVIFL